jgi:hypothetical protein
MLDFQTIAPPNPEIRRPKNVSRFASFLAKFFESVSEVSVKNFELSERSEFSKFRKRGENRFQNEPLKKDLLVLFSHEKYRIIDYGIISE